MVTGGGSESGGSAAGAGWTVFGATRRVGARAAFAVAVGVKVTSKLQAPLAGTVAVKQSVAPTAAGAATAKSGASAPPNVARAGKVIGLPLVLVTVTVWGAEVAGIVTLPRSRV